MRLFPLPIIESYRLRVREPKRQRFEHHTNTQLHKLKSPSTLDWIATRWLPRLCVLTASRTVSSCSGLSPSALRKKQRTCANRDDCGAGIGLGEGE